MSRFYTNPKDETDPNKLPDAEVFWASDEEIGPQAKEEDSPYAGGEGWYVWFCYPGCLPDGEPMGPFESETDAIRDWRAYFSDELEDES